ncbi:phage major tail tube protein [Palleronia caenipelagi]|uniref:Phage tail protein n=1 Tax=Palleronia caenipelagi TaxID=2489174 RepID=A0A547PSE2_9RHOB|nr:phage major tail tube protein [Palleronia caenipelagi]TRD16974.1 phage tail protein [Palleronia caenipelagi]
MKSTPAYILRRCAFWADEDVKVGQVESLTVPLPKEKTEEIRNAGMIKSRKVVLGYEMEDLDFTMTAFDPATLKLMTGRPGSEHVYYATGAFVDEDGTTHSAELYLRGRLSALDNMEWKEGDKATLKCTVVTHYCKLEIDGAPIFEIDDFDYSVGGVSQTGDIRAALLL